MAKNDRKRPGSLQNAFQKAMRHRLGTLTLSFTLLASCGTTTLRGQTPSTAPVETGNRIEVTITPQTSAQEQDSLRRIEVRRILLAEARSRYKELMPMAETGYSQELDSLETHLRQYLKARDTSRHNTIVVLDPTHTDVAIALGIPLPAAVMADIYKDAPERVLPFDVIMRAADHMADPYVSGVGISTYTQTPSAYPNKADEAARPCLIVPMSDHAVPFSIPGMTYRQKTEFGNTHEGWHCLDSRYSLSDAQYTALDTLEIRDFKALATSPVGISAVSQLNGAETLADVAALGDMVRQGHGTAVIDAAINWRKANMPNDYVHYSVPALNALKEHIDSVGLDTFRKTSHDTARALYLDITDKERLTATRLTTALAYQNGSVENRAALIEAAKTDTETAKALAFARNMTPDPMLDLINSITTAMRPIDVNMGAKLREWDVIGTLEKKAIEQGGMITPETITRAYGAVQDSLRTDMLNGGNEYENREKMVFTRALFTRYVQMIDYVDANERHGVDIEKSAADLLRAGREALRVSEAAKTLQIIPLPASTRVGPEKPQRVAGCGCGVKSKGPG